jgi:formylglycine-generating enzyme required for sulfatase activity
MRLFVSYARVDRPFCKQIVKTLDVHQVWFDERLHAGQKWWDQILKRLEWCEGFVYLLSPDSVESEYCRKEMNIARAAGKHIFPVIIQARTRVPRILADYQHIDLTEGLTNESVKALLDAIYVAERGHLASVGVSSQAETPVRLRHDNVNPSAMIDEAAEALNASQYDRAVFLLKTSLQSGYTSRYIDLSAMLDEAEQALARQHYLQDAEREYAPILALVRRERTREMGRAAFHAFRQNYPDYDPHNLAEIFDVPPSVKIDWCDVPSGEAVVYSDGDTICYQVAPFQMSRYPITNQQYQAFIDAPDGYHQEQWWTYSPYAREWHHKHCDPMPVNSADADLPRVNVCWYEAVAFCLWLSHQTGLDIRLPSESQWVRAASGDDGRLYPWGDEFDPSRCNVRESDHHSLTPVNAHPNGVSPFGLLDMAGNAWEWCLSKQGGLDDYLDLVSRAKRAVRGGSYISPHNRSRNDFHYHLSPRCRYDTIGFRVVCVPG